MKVLESDFEKHLEDVCSALNGKVAKDVLAGELHLFVDDYHVSIVSAKRSIVKKHGGDPDALLLGTDRNIGELAGGMNGVDITGRIVQITRRSINASGEQKEVLSGRIEDDTGSVPFTIWETTLDAPKAGDLVSIRNAYTTTYRDRPQLNISSRSRIIVRESGEGWTRKPRKIAEINAGEDNICVEGKIVSVASRTVNSRGEEKAIQYGLMGDETKTVRFTSWGDFHLEKGETVRVEGAYSREHNGEVQLNFGERAAVVRMEKGTIESVARFGTPREYSVSELRDGMGNVIISGQVVSVEKKEYEREGEKREMFTGIIADETGQISFTAWCSFPFAAGENVRISGAYVREWKGIPQLKLDDKSEIKKEAGEVTPSLTTSYTIEDLENRGGAIDAEITATVIEVRQGSGLVMRCPECGRATKLGECRNHGAVQGIPDFRLRLVLDDGTGSISAQFDRGLSEKLTGLGLDEIRSICEKAMDQEAAIPSIAERVLFRILTVTGRVFTDDFGLNMRASGLSEAKLEVEEKASELFADMAAKAGM
ncbi:MAG: hypothetical protein QXP70_05145 [Methanomassiliicoccales archaeon]